MKAKIRFHQIAVCGDCMYALDSNGRIWFQGLDRKWVLEESPDVPEEDLEGFKPFYDYERRSDAV